MKVMEFRMTACVTAREQVGGGFFLGGGSSDVSARGSTPELGATETARGQVSGREQLCRHRLSLVFPFPLSLVDRPGVSSSAADGKRRRCRSIATRDGIPN